MSNVQIITGDARISGDLTVGGSLKPARPRTDLLQEQLAVHPIRLSDFKVWDAQATNLPTAGATDDLGLYTGTWGTHAPKLSTGDVKAAGAVTRRAAIVLQLPPEYDPGETIQLRLSCAVETTIADTSATVDVEAYLVGRDGTIDGADLVTTAAQSINSVTWADKTFTIDAATLSPGDEVFIRITIAVNDAATATAVQPSIGAVEALLDIRG